jgi:hypothetical protein
MSGCSKTEPDPGTPCGQKMSLRNFTRRAVNQRPTMTLSGPDRRRQVCGAGEPVLQHGGGGTTRTVDCCLRARASDF